MKFKNYLFDFDGTLADTYPVMAKALSDVFDFVTPEMLLPWLNVSFSHCKSQLSQFEQYDLAKLEQYNQLMLEYELDNQAYDGVAKFLNWIVQQGGRCFVITHRDGSTGRILKNLQLSQYFTEIIDSSYGFKRKPDPQAVTYLIHKYNMQLDETIFIGDRQLDLDAGKNAGISTGWVRFNEFNLTAYDFEIREYRHARFVLENTRNNVKVIKLDLCYQDVWLDLEETRPANPQQDYIMTYHYNIWVGQEAVGHISLRVGFNYRLYLGGNIGYVIEPPYQGHGYAYQACQALLPLIKHYQFKTLLITCLADNQGSRKTIEKLPTNLIDQVILPENNLLNEKAGQLFNIYEWLIKD